MLSNLKGCLRSCYKPDKDNFKNSEFCEELSRYLNEFENFCDFLIKESKGSEVPLNDQFSSEESETSQDMGDFYE